MPYAYVEPDVFLEHKGVTVYHTYRDGTNEPWEYWFTTKKEDADDFGHRSHFDVRKLTGLWPDTPTVAEWDGWWKHRFKREDEAIRALLRTAIEDNTIH